MDFLKELGSYLVGVDDTPLDVSRIGTLESELERLWSEYDFEIIERFRSRKNIVVRLGALHKGELVPLELVAKLFVTDHFENELKILKASREKGLAVPRVISAIDGILLMPYVMGEPLTTRINRTFEEALIDELAEWYYRFHEAHALLKGDSRLRNFICGENPLVGLDFEESRSGHWMFDIAGASASLLDTRPVYDTRKRKLAWRLLEQYLNLRGDEQTPKIDRLFIETVSDTLQRTAHWRKDNAIMELADQIRRSGIALK